MVRPGNCASVDRYVGEREMQHDEKRPRSTGTRKSTRPQLPWPETHEFRILSIDGGGIRGILPAAFLARCEKLLPPGRSLAEYFDLIAGTSTGGIIALGLASGKSAEHLLDLYVTRGSEIFPPTWLGKGRLIFKGARGTIFDRAKLDAILTAEFGNKPFSDASTRLCIPAVEGEYGEPYIYKTPHHDDYRSDWSRSMFEVARATSAAPVFLREVKQGAYTLLDGGLFANDPVMVATVDALTCFKLRRAQLRILSVGCLGDHWNLRRVQSLGRGWIAWSKFAYEITGSLQSHNAQGQAGLLVGPKNIIRVNAPQPQQRIGLDDWRRSRTELPLIADQLFEENSAAIKEMFFRAPADIYSPQCT